MSVMEELPRNGSTEKENQTRSLTEKHIQLFLKDRNDRSAKAFLSEDYWNCLSQLLDRKVKSENGDCLSFSKKEKLTIDFGILSPDMVSEKSFYHCSEASDALPPEGAKNRMMFFTDWLSDRYLEIKGANLVRNYRDRILSVEHKRKALFEKDKEYRSQCVGYINQVQPYMDDKDGLVASLRDVTGSMLGMIYAHRELTRKVNARISITVSEKQSYIEMDRKMAELAEQQTNLLNQIRFLGAKQGIPVIVGDIANNIAQIMRDIERDTVELVELTCEKNDILANITSTREKVKNITRDEVSSKLRELADWLKKIVMIISKRSKTDPSPVLFSDRPVFNRVKLLAAMDEIESHDPELFNNRRVRKFGRPDILLMPCSGNGIYDWEKNIFIIPVVPVKDFMESVATAFVDYRWDVDEDRDMRQSYSEIKEYEGLPLLKLKEQLTKDYTTWLTREMKGYKILSKDVREWFAWKFTPKDKQQEPQVFKKAPAGPVPNGEHIKEKVKELKDIMKEGEAPRGPGAFVDLDSYLLEHFDPSVLGPPDPKVSVRPGAGGAGHFDISIRDFSPSSEEDIGLFRKLLKALSGYKNESR